MVAPLIARAAGAQLAKSGAARAAGGQLAKNAPRVAGKSATNSFMAPKEMKGPVYGYTEPKIAQSDIDVIKDWQGNLDNKKNDGNINKIGERLSPQNIGSIKRTEENVEENQSAQGIAKNYQIDRSRITNNARNLANYAPERRMATPRPKLNGAGYFLVLFVTIFKDVLDFVFELLGFVLEIFIVTMPLGFLLEIIDWVLDFTVLIITQGFFMLNGVKMNSKKWGFQGATTAIEAIPFVGALPINSISFAYQVVMINRERKQEETDEQIVLDQEYEQEQAQYMQIMQTQYNQNIAEANQMEQQVQNTSTLEKAGNKATGNEWKEMVDQSEQNITKMNNQNSINNTSEVKK